MTIEQSIEQNEEKQKKEELYIMGEKMEETDALNSTEININDCTTEIDLNESINCSRKI